MARYPTSLGVPGHPRTSDRQVIRRGVPDAFLYIVGPAKTILHFESDLTNLFGDLLELLVNTLPTIVQTCLLTVGSHDENVHVFALRLFIHDEIPVENKERCLDKNILISDELGTIAQNITSADDCSESGTCCIDIL